MLGVIVNSVIVIIGGIIGSLCRRGIPEKIIDALMSAVGLSVIYLGFDNALSEGADALSVILGMALGTAVGTILDIDGAVSRLGDKIQNRFAKEGGTQSLAEGFVTASLLFCVGAMAVTGSIQAGQGDNTILFTKSVLDGISSTVLSVSLGIGVALSSASVFVFQGAISLASGLIVGLLSETMTACMVCAGGILIAALGFNMLGMTKIKVANSLPALVLAPVISLLFV